VRIDGLEATANFYNWDDHIVTTGMEYRKETRDSSAINPNPQSSEFITKIVTYKSLFIQDEIEFGEGWSANLGARYDDISNADQKTTFKAGILKALTDNTRLRANYSQGYRAPDIAELYVVAPFFRDARRFGSDVVFGPKQTVYDLKPETSQTFEVAMAHSTENFRAEVVAFRNLIDDKIEIVAKNNGMPSKYYTSENLDSVEINGVEVSAVYQMSQPLRLGFDAVWLDPINRTNDKKLTYTPELSASLSLDYQMTNRMTVSAIGRYIGEQFEDVANTQSIDAYHLIDLSMSYDWESNTQLYAGINNLADKSVDLALGANVGRYFYAGIKHQF
jgi:outer membrane receptor for ferrienterochelin and colicins